MKKILIILTMIILSTMIFTTIGLADSSYTPEIDLFYDIQSLGYEKVYVNQADNIVNIKIAINERDFIADLSKIFVYAYNRTDAYNFQIELYDSDNKLFTISTTREIINQYIGNQITEDELLNQLNYQDERSIEEKLKVDLEMFDTIVYGLKLDQKNCEIDLYYNGDDLNTLITDLPNMHLLVIEHAPWITNTTINLENHQKNEYLQFTLKTDDLLKLLNQEIGYEEYYDSASISVEKNGSWLDSVKQIGTIDLILLLVVVISGIYGLVKGFVATLFSFLSYFLAIIGAKMFAPKVAGLFSINTVVTNKIDMSNLSLSGIDISLFNSEMISYYVITAISMVVIFIVLKVLISYIGKFLNNRIKVPSVARANRIMGFILGTFTGFIILAIVSLIITPLALSTSNTTLNNIINNSLLIEKLSQIVIF